MNKLKNEIGNQYGNLTVIERGQPHPTKKLATWRCRCECGGETTVLGVNLRSHVTRSCGCLPSGARSKNEIGKRYGRLLVIAPAPHHKSIEKRVEWLCKCDCGKETIVVGTRMRKGQTLSCGCIRKGRVTTHGLCQSPEYKTWSSMIQRCHNPKTRSFRHYGGLGISVCDRWRKSFLHFLSDMGARPKGTTLDRIDSKANYEPGNVRWATDSEQSRNRRRYASIEQFTDDEIFAELHRRKIQNKN